MKTLRAYHPALNKDVEFAVPGTSLLRVMRDSRSIIRREGIPKPYALVDTREQLPFRLRKQHPNWFAGERRVTLKTGDYSVDGMKELLALERKSLADVVACASPNASRKRFLKQCERLAQFKWKAILVEATLEDIKRGFVGFNIECGIHPNAVCGTLDAVEAKFGIPIIYASSIRELATERAASWLSKHFTYWWLEKHGLGRVLIDTDGL